MSASCCPQPRKPAVRMAVESFAFTVHPRGPCRAEEELADQLDLEVRAHAVTRESLASAQAELKRLRPVLEAVREVHAVLNTPTILEQEDAHLSRLAGPLLQLELVSLLSSPPEASASDSTAQSAEVSHG